MTIIVAPAKDVPALIARWQPRRVLSLVSPDTDQASFDKANACNHRILRFNDISVPTQDLITPTPEIVASLLDFGRPWDTVSPFLVHCWAGISRSTAAAFILACLHGRAGEEDEAAAALRAASASATPNPLMVQLADELMGRRGEMVRAIKAIGRGAEAGFGTPFEYRIAR